jgi:hypothetical protein
VSAEGEAAFEGVFLLAEAVVEDLFDAVDDWTEGVT